MLTGYDGHLVGEQFLDAHLDDCFGEGSSPLSGSTLRAWRAERQLLGPASSLRAIVDVSAVPLLVALGFSALREHGRTNNVAYLTAADLQAPLAVLVTGWSEPLAPLSAPAVRFALAQRAAWCLLFNGTHLRLVAARSSSRRFFEFDLDAVADEPRTADALWVLLNRAALSREAGAHSLKSLVDGSDKHAASVSTSLRAGVLEASEQLLGALLSNAGRRTGRPAATSRESGQAKPGSLDDGFGQALTIVYRLLFLLFAEARSLLPVWHPVYRDSYALERLCEKAQRNHLPGLWDTLRAISRLSHAGCRAGDLRVTAFNGRLFSPARTPLAERRDLDDDAARRSLVALASRPAPDGEGRVRVSYRELGVEQLGAVYETLLDYAPVVEKEEPTGRRQARRRVALTAGSGARKRTGSFYTPQSLTRYLIEQTLAPLVHEAPLERILSLRVLDPAMGSGAFLVGACEYLADACEAALIRDGQCHSHDVGPRERASLRRQIAERCLFGVDLNPMAVQLARLSLWLTTLASDRPLSFLDHHLRAGDSLLGTWLHCLTRPPRMRQRREVDLPLFDVDRLEDSLRDTVPARFALLQPSTTLAEVRAKEQALARLERADSPLFKWKQIADLWCASWFASELADQSRSFPALCDVILARGGALPPGAARPLLELSAKVAAKHSFFHWELEFPEVYFDEAGRWRPGAGFDAIIGNPPWDMVRVDRDLGDESRRDAANVVRFSRDAGVYRAQSDGHANRYQLFLERSLELLAETGRIGMVLPAGLIADQGSATLRRHLFSRCAVETIVGFDNRRAIFPIHRSIRFILLIGRAGEPTTTCRCRLGESDPAALDPPADAAGAHRPGLTLSVDLLRAISGDDLSIPDLRSAHDLSIVEHAARRFPKLGAADGWQARFGRELNATDDRGCFVTTARAGRLPVLEGKHLEPFVVETSQATRFIAEKDAALRLGERHLAPRLAYRDVASATNRTTLIAGILPARSVSTHTLFCLRTPLGPVAQWFLCGLFNSLVVNYLVRLRVSTHVTTAIVEALPIPREDEAGPAFRAIAAMARSMARRRSPAVWACLNARVARLYGLSREDLVHILSTFPLVEETEREAALRAFER